MLWQVRLKIKYIDYHQSLLYTLVDASGKSPLKEIDYPKETSYQAAYAIFDKFYHDNMFPLLTLEEIEEDLEKQQCCIVYSTYGPTKMEIPEYKWVSFNDFITQSALHSCKAV